MSDAYANKSPLSLWGPKVVKEPGLFHSIGIEGQTCPSFQVKRGKADFGFLHHG